MDTHAHNLNSKEYITLRLEGCGHLCFLRELKSMETQGAPLKVESVHFAGDIQKYATTYLVLSTPQGLGTGVLGVLLEALSIGRYEGFFEGIAYEGPQEKPADIPAEYNASAVKKLEEPYGEISKPNAPDPAIS